MSDRRGLRKLVSVAGTKPRRAVEDLASELELERARELDGMMSEFRARANSIVSN